MDDFKRFYILIRDDLKVSVGKLMVHVGHLCTEMTHHYLCHDDRPDLVRKFNKWYFDSKQTKILLRIKNLEELRSFWATARLKHALMTFEACFKRAVAQKLRRLKKERY